MRRVSVPSVLVRQPITELGRAELLMKLHLRATVCQLPYGIAQCYLSPDTSELTPP